LNTIPNGFNLTDDGTHLRVLQWIFTPEEAELTSRLKLSGETIEVMSERLEIPPNELTKTLDNMVNKGQIRRFVTFSGNVRYALMPFVVGIYEDQLERMDKEFAEIMEEYFEKTGYSELFGTQPPVHRIIPVNKAITPELSIFPYDTAENLLENAQSWGVRECICKKHQELLGEKCQYSKNVCLTFSSLPDAYVESDVTKSLTKQEAIELLKQAEEEGLVHNSMNVQQGHDYICNCCGCCCGVIRGLTERDQPAAFVKSNYHIHIDKELCIACGDCEDRCQFGALEVEETCEVDLKKCVGCGVCVLTCEDEALILVERADTDKVTPPEDLKSWMMKKALSRRVDPRKHI
jgi:ferredoxin